MTNESPPAKTPLTLFVARSPFPDGSCSPKSYTLEAESVEDAVCVVALIFGRTVDIERFDPLTRKTYDKVRVERLPRAWYLYDDFGFSFWALGVPGIAVGQVFGFRSRDPAKVLDAAASFLPGTVEDRESIFVLAETLPQEAFGRAASEYLALRGALEDPVFAAAAAFPGGYRRLLEKVVGPTDERLSVASKLKMSIH